MDKKLISGLIVSGISLSPDTDDKEACLIAANELKRAGISPARIRLSIYKQSVDARKKNDIKLVYSVAARFDAPTEIAIPTSKKYRISAMPWLVRSVAPRKVPSPPSATMASISCSSHVLSASAMPSGSLKRGERLE